MSARELRPALGPASLLLLGLGCVIGTGVWVLTGRAAAEYAGPGLIWSFVIAGAFCLIIAFCYSELATSMPSAGTAYAYTYVSMGRFAGWITGLLILLAYGLAAATVAVGWSGYVVSILNDIGIHLPAELQSAPGVSYGGGPPGVVNLPAIAGVLGATIVLCLGVTRFAAFNNILTLFKLGVIVAFIGLGVAYINPANWTPFIPPGANLAEGINFIATGNGLPKFGVGGVVAASSIVFFAFIGFELPSAAGAEAKNIRYLPLAIVGSVVISLVLYIGVTLVAVGVVPYTELNNYAPIAMVSERMGLPWFGFVVKMAALAGLTTVMITLLYGQSRVFIAMARDGLLPPIFAALTADGTPAVGAWAIGILAAAVSGFLALDQLADLTNLGMLAVFALVCISVIAMRVTRPELARPFKTPLYPLLPLLGVIGCIVIILTLLRNNFSVMALVVFFGCGLGLFFISGLWRIGRSAVRLLMPEPDNLAYASTLRAPAPFPAPPPFAPPTPPPAPRMETPVFSPPPPPPITAPPPRRWERRPGEPNDVFISYRRKEKPRVEAIAQALRDLRLHVWFDAELEAGRNFDEEINREVRSVKAVLVCWSAGGVESRWVRAEADIGHRRNVLVACALEECDPWTPFNLVHSEDLSGGVLDGTNRAWVKIVDRIGDLTKRPGLVDYVRLTNDRRACEEWLARYGDDPLAELVAARIR